jgi:hypothetical protein
MRLDMGASLRRFGSRKRQALLGAERLAWTHSPRPETRFSARYLIQHDQKGVEAMSSRSPQNARCPVAAGVGEQVVDHLAEAGLVATTIGCSSWQSSGRAGSTTLAAETANSTTRSRAMGRVASGRSSPRRASSSRSSTSCSMRAASSSIARIAISEILGLGVAWLVDRAQRNVVDRALGAARGVGRHWGVT